jgi:hypothetical protein
MRNNRRRDLRKNVLGEDEPWRNLPMRNNRRRDLRKNVLGEDETLEELVSR